MCTPFFYLCAMKKEKRRILYKESVSISTNLETKEREISVNFNRLSKTKVLIGVKKSGSLNGVQEIGAKKTIQNPNGRNKQVVLNVPKVWNDELKTYVSDFDGIEGYQKANHLAKSVKITGKARCKAQEDARKAPEKAMKLSARYRRDEFIQTCKDNFFKVSKGKRLKLLGTNKLNEYIENQMNLVGY